MMKPRRTEVLMKSLDLMLKAVIGQHQSHAARNRELWAIRGILNRWLEAFNAYTSEADEKTEARQTLEAVFELCIWNLDNETHSQVKDRLYLARAIIRLYFGRVQIQRYHDMAKRGLAKIDALEFEHVGDDLVPAPTHPDDVPF